MVLSNEIQTLVTEYKYFVCPYNKKALEHEIKLKLKIKLGDLFRNWF